MTNPAKNFNWLPWIPGSLTKYVISRNCGNRPLAHWGTSPVGSPRRKIAGAPLRYVGLRGDCRTSLKPDKFSCFLRPLESSLFLVYI